MDDQVWVPTVFTKNRDRLLEAEVEIFTPALFTPAEHRKTVLIFMARDETACHGRRLKLSATRSVNLRRIK